MKIQSIYWGICIASLAFTPMMADDAQKEEETDGWASAQAQWEIFQKEYLPKTKYPPEDVEADQRAKEYLEKTFEKMRRDPYAMQERNPDKFAPHLKKAVYYHWQDEDGQDYRRTDCFNANNQLVEQYIENPDGIFGTVNGVSGRMVDTYLLGRPESMALSFSHFVWEFGRFSITEEVHDGRTCPVIEMGMIKTDPPKAAFFLMANRVDTEFQIPYYPALRFFVLDPDTGMITSCRKYNLAGEQLAHHIFTPLKQLPDFSKSFFATPEIDLPTKSRMQASLREAVWDYQFLKNKNVGDSVWKRAFRARSLETISWVIGGVAAGILLLGIGLKKWKKLRN